MVNNYFQEASDNLQLAESEATNDPNALSVAVLLFPTLIIAGRAMSVPVTHTKFDGDAVLAAEGGGFSSTSAVERCEFRAALVPAIVMDKIKKGLRCDLIIRTGLPAKNMQLWTGGLLAGGEVFRFMLVNSSYKG